MITKKNSCSSKIPLPPNNFSNGPSLKSKYPDRDILSNVPRSGYIRARDQSIEESGVTEGEKNTASILFREWTQ